MLKKIEVLSIIFLLGVALLPRLTLAQSSAYLESRVSRLESDNSLLRSQVSQLASQVSQLTGSRLPRIVSTSPPPSLPRGQSRQSVSSDPIVSRLATLVIELKQRIQRLETQVSALKRRVGG